MELKSVLRFAGLVLSPACACLIITAGCTTESELPMPPGAYVPPPEKPIPPENSASSTEPEFTPARETAVFPSDTEEQTFTPEDLAAEDLPVAPEPAVKPESSKKGAAEPGKDDIIYTIRKNDTLGGIARRHGMSAATLANYNGITLKSKIYAGKTLRIPATVKTSASSTTAAKTSAVPEGASVYVVKSGDTLGGIAQRHGVRTADLAAANNLDVRKPIRVGQKLVLPAGAKKKTESAASSSAAAKTSASSTKKSAASSAKSSAKKTTAAASSSSTASAAKESAPAAAAKEPATTASSAGQTTASADDLLKNIGSEPETASASSAPAVSAGTGSVSVAPSAAEEVFDADNTIEINIEREMTLEETARAFDRSYSTVKKLNPDIQPDVRLKAGTAVKIPIF